MRQVCLIVPGQPPSKPRPRRGAGGHFYTPRIKDDTGMAWRLKIACEYRPFEGPVEVWLGFFRRTKRAIDVDNLVKWVLDEGNGGAWKDDSQVKVLRASLDVSRENPRTEIVIMEVEEHGVT